MEQHQADGGFEFQQRRQKRTEQAEICGSGPRTKIPGPSVKYWAFSRITATLRM